VNPLDWIDQELADLESQGLRRRMRNVVGPQRALLRVDGIEAINFSSNSYLGLSDHPELAEAARAVLTEEGAGAGASRLIAGNQLAHRQLETAIARFKSTPAALFFNSGYQANVGTLQALLGPEDAVFSDTLNHASIIDGCRLARAQVHVYRHADATHLAELLSKAPPARRRLIVTESLFSMDGDRAPLTELAKLARSHGAMLMVDEAHATGVLGPDGRGLAAAAGIVPDIQMGTLGKAMGAAGAYIAGSTSLIEFLFNKARSFVFTTAPPAAMAATAHRALDLATGPLGRERRAQLMLHVKHFHEGLRNLDVPTPSDPSHIIPLLVGETRRAMLLSERLLRAGIFAHGIRPPTVPEGTSRIRFSLMATHTTSQLERALSALADLKVLFRPLPAPPSTTP